MNQLDQTLDPELTTGQISHLVGCSTNSVKRWIFNGELKADLSSSRRWRIKMSDLVAFIKAREVKKENHEHKLLS